MKILPALLLFWQVTVWGQNYGKLHFSEDFDDNSNGWSEVDDENHVNKIKKGKFTMKHKNSETGAYYYVNIPTVDFEKENFVIEAKVRQTEGDASQAYGLRYCIYSDNSNYRNFYLTSNGYYKVSHFYNKKEDKQIDWKQDEKVVNKLGEYNILRIERNASLLKYYVNDHFVGYSDNNKYFTGRIGFYVSAVNTMEIDYLKIWTSPLIMNLVENPLENVTPENLGAQINTDSIEKSPIISADGQTLYFARSNPDIPLKDRGSNIYFSTIDENGEWTLAKPIGEPLNNDGKNSVVFALPDGNTLILMNHYTPSGELIGGGISMTKRTADGWEFPTNFKVEDYHNRSPFAGFTLSPSRKVMIFSAQRDETTGERDLYVSFVQEDGTWSKPKGIGSTINTFANEDTPFLAPDNKTLYFSSEGHPGFGRSDVFVSKRLDDTWLNWSTPLNLGKAVNTRSSEYGFKISAKGDYAYFYKTGKKEEGGFGDGDIYRIKLSESAKPDPVVFITGQVFDSDTKEPLSAEIVYEDLQEHKELGVANSEPKEGRYKIALPYGKVYGFLAKRNGYYPISQNVDLSKVEELKTIVQDLYLTPIKKGVAIRLNNIFFEYDKSDLQKISYKELDRLAQMMNENAEWKIEIGGHTDNMGSDSYNKDLSTRRAAEVKKYLIQKGISSDRLSSKGYGEEKPVSTNDTDEGRAENRRVEFIILN